MEHPNDAVLIESYSLYDNTKFLPLPVTPLASKEKPKCKSVSAMTCSTTVLKRCR